MLLAACVPPLSPQRGHPLEGGAGLWRWPDPGRGGGTLHEPLGELGDTPHPPRGTGDMEWGGQGGTKPLEEAPGCCWQLVAADEAVAVWDTLGMELGDGTG